MLGRSERTKKYIRVAFLKLLSDQALDKITVKKISELAKINRNTFYTYFDSVYKLNDEIFNKISHDLSLQQIATDDDFDDYAKQVLDYFFDYFNQHRTILSLAFNTPQGKALAATLISEAISQLRIMSRTRLSDQLALAQLSFDVYAVTGVLSQWLNGKLNGSKDELIKFTYDNIKLPIKID